MLLVVLIAYKCIILVDKHINFKLRLIKNHNTKPKKKPPLNAQNAHDETSINILKSQFNDLQTSTYIYIYILGHI